MWLFITGQRINELENGPSSYRLKKQLFSSNRVGFDVVKDLSSYIGWFHFIIPSRLQYEPNMMERQMKNSH